ncbi:MAG: hypothetical protein E7Z93_05095 [Cyanobacteria bacterium SIG32]|nr:hypothetical protein [Cyanobacteria bacterium SIG32]
MRPNLIQTYMNNMPQVPPEKKDRNLDINHVLSNRTFIKPLPGNGKLVEKNILAAPADIAKGIGYDMRSLKRASKGDANDHELGKINDVGMKLGGLAIAAYLMTRKQTPLKKAMELVGLASFFGAMSLWPKVAIQLPTRLIHGFNVKKEYEDSFQRQKPFFQDPMYIPWDLVDDKRIHKIGDRMGVDKDMPNRKDFIQEKMKKISVQDNTLWMLTAGIATPIASALICNACEKPLNKFLGKQTEKKAERLLGNIGESYAQYVDNSAKEFSELLDANSGRPITSELLEQIKGVLTQNIDDVTATAIKEDLDVMLGATDKKFVVNETVVDGVVKTIKEEMKGIIPEAQIDNCVPKSEDLLRSLSQFTERDLNDGEMKKVLNTILAATKKSLKENNVEDTQIQTVVRKLVNGDSKAVEKALHSSPAEILSENIVSKLKSISGTLSTFKAKNAVLDEYILLKAGAAPETVMANAWNEVTGDLPKLFNLTDKEITSIRHDRKLTGALLREKLEAITSNPDEYDRVFRALAGKISKLEDEMSELEIPASSKGSYNSSVEKVFGDAADELKESGFNSTARRLVGTGDNAVGSLKNIQLSYSQNRLLGVRSSLYRMLNTLDLFKRISTNENLQALHPGMKKEMKEAIVEFVKQLAIEGSTSDYMTKFFASKNPNMAQALGDLVVEAGKVDNEFLSQMVQGGKTETPYDKVFYEEVMKLFYENDVHPNTKKILGELDLEDVFGRYRGDFLDNLGGHYYFVKPYHKVAGKSGAGSSYTKFLRVGMAPDQMLHGTIKEVFNTRQWLKTFGGIGAGLLGLTVLAQFFFGKMKTPERVEK